MKRVVAVLLDLYHVVAVVGGVVLAAVLVYAVSWLERPRRRPPASREWMIWVGDGIAPAGPHMIGWPVRIGGRTGKVVDATALKIQVEWDDG